MSNYAHQGSATTSTRGSHGENYGAVPQRPYSFQSEAVQAKCLFRAANSDESASQRIHRQQAATGVQLQRINKSLGRSNSDQSHTGRTQRGLVGDDLLLGVGSQFDSGSRPAPPATNDGHGGRH